MNNELKVTLKPCPFCGDEEINITHVVSGSSDPKNAYWDVECCGDCLVRPSVIGATEEEAIRNWNSRPSSDVKMSEARARELTKEHGDEWTPVSESYPCGEMDVQTKVIADGHLHIEIAKLRKSGLFSNEIKVNGKLVREVTHWRFINTYPTEAHKTESELRAIIKQLREGLGSIRTAGIPYCDGGCVAQAKEILERTKEE